MGDGRLGRAGRAASALVPRLRFLQGLVTRVHRSVYRATGGRLGSNLGGANMLLLTTTGRRSGQPREVPLLTFRDGDDWVVVGSNFGRPDDPAWILNVRADPRVRVQVGREKFDGLAQVVEGPEHERLWAKALEVNDGFDDYAARSGRDIRIVTISRSDRT